MEKNSTEKKTILIADDDVDLLLQLKLQFEAAGFAVITAESGRDAEKVFAQTRPDLAVLDLMMEQMDAGFTLSYHIKKKDPSIPIILITGVTHETGFEFEVSSDEERSWIKADAILDKPIRFEQLMREIERLIK